MQRYQYDIRKEAVTRGISRLYHFTHAGNARSILSNGFLSRNVLLANGVDFLATDTMRLDDQLDAVSVSIHSINESMFAAKKREYGGEWLIFEINASLLWTHSCRFCWKNAATSEIRGKNGFMGGPWAFSKMFDDRAISSIDNRSYRGVFERANCEPTDNAAEVQVFDPIAPDLIIDVTVRSQRIKDELEVLMQEINHVKPVVVYEEIFCRG